jgi:hypothetical protein
LQPIARREAASASPKIQRMSPGGMASILFESGNILATRDDRPSTWNYEGRAGAM